MCLLHLREQMWRYSSALSLVCRDLRHRQDQSALMPTSHVLLTERWVLLAD